MKIQSWSIGKSHETYVKEGIELFSARIEHYFPFNWHILSPPKQAANMEIPVLKEEEGKKVLEIAKTERVLASKRRFIVINSLIIARNAFYDALLNG